MTQIRYVEVTPRRFRLQRAKEVVETQLIGLWRTVPRAGTAERTRLVGWNLRLEDGNEIPLAELMAEWGDTTVGTPDLHSNN